MTQSSAVIVPFEQPELFFNVRDQNRLMCKMPSEPFSSELAIGASTELAVGLTLEFAVELATIGGKDSGGLLIGMRNSQQGCLVKMWGE